MNTNQKISSLILSKMEAGLQIEQAYDAVLGAGAYSGLADDVWTQLRTRFCINGLTSDKRGPYKTIEG